MGRPAKYKKVAEQLHERIRAGDFAANEMLPPEAELAEAYDVNRLTLRRAIDLLAEDGVVARQEGRGTIVGAATERLLYIGPTEEHFFQQLYARICSDGQDRGMTITSFTPRENGNGIEQLRQLLQEADWVVCVEDKWSRVRPILNGRRNIVRIGGFLTHDYFDCKDPGYLVSGDLYRAAKLATHHLYDLGHRRIALHEAGTGGADGPLVRDISSQRATCLGYRSALREVEIDEEFLLGTSPTMAGEWHEEEFASARHFLKIKKPTAVVCAGDFRAGPLLRAANDLGLQVPHDLSVVGLGNTPWAQWLNPPLTTVSLGEDRLAHLALVLASEPMPDEFEVIRVAPKLIERQSTAKPNRNA